jgi:hypothetical protein
MPEPKEILTECFDEANVNLETSNIADETLKTKILTVCNNVSNKAPIRFLLSCLLAKQHNNSNDIRKPYTEIGGSDTFSGRHYDEAHLQPFLIEKQLPTNVTTAYLTPAFRNINRIVDKDIQLVGRPPIIYEYTKELIGKVYDGSLTPRQLMIEIFRNLINLKIKNEKRIVELKEDLNNGNILNELSSEQIINLLIQHLACKNSSRLPVLIVASAYESVKDLVGEKPMPLEAHNAADSQTGSIGDIVITLLADDKKVTSYEMKDKLVTQNDIDLALKKIADSKLDIDNYIFITTEKIDPEVQEYAVGVYETTGIEMVILDCIGFIRHFLYFFHRYRTSFLDNYEALVLSEPTSSVGQALKEAFLSLKKAALADH